MIGVKFAPEHQFLVIVPVFPKFKLVDTSAVYPMLTTGDWNESDSVT